jgi:hypothetical protein
MTTRPSSQFGDAQSQGRASVVDAFGEGVRRVGVPDGERALARRLYFLDLVIRIAGSHEYLVMRSHRDHTILSPTAVRKLVEALKKGASLKMAAQVSGVHYQYLVKCLSRGRLGEPKYSGLARVVDLAISKYELTRIQAVSTAGDKDWRAAAWELERRRPEEYGTEKKLIRELVHTVSTLEQVVQTLVRMVPADDLERAGLAGLRQIGQVPAQALAEVRVRPLPPSAPRDGTAPDAPAASSGMVPAGHQS